jgi:hypothetical protein
MRSDVVYQKYMESILALGTEEFGEIKDIIARFDTLAATNNELIERSRLAQERTESDRMAFTKSVEVILKLKDNNNRKKIISI